MMSKHKFAEKPEGGESRFARKLEDKETERIRKIISIFPCPLKEEFNYYHKNPIVKKVIDEHVRQGCSACEEKRDRIISKSSWFNMSWLPGPLALRYATVLAMILLVPVLYAALSKKEGTTPLAASGQGAAIVAKPMEPPRNVMKLTGSFVVHDLSRSPQVSKDTSSARLGVARPKKALAVYGFTTPAKSALSRKRPAILSRHIRKTPSAQTSIATKQRQVANNVSSPTMIEGKAGITGGKVGATMQSGEPYNPDDIFASLNVGSELARRIESYPKGHVILYVKNTESPSSKPIAVRLKDAWNQKNCRDWLIQLSPAAAKKIGFYPKKGFTNVKIYIRELQEGAIPREPICIAPEKD